MENQMQRNPLNKISTSLLDNNYLAFLEKKFTEMNSELAGIYESTIKEDNDCCDKNLEKANNVIDIFKILLDDTEIVKKNLMEVMNPESKEEMMEIELEEKKFQFDFDLSKISNYRINLKNNVKNNSRKKIGVLNKDIKFPNYIQDPAIKDNKIVFDKNDLNFLCGNIKAETKQVTEDSNNLQNIIGKYRERIKEAANYVIPQTNPNSSAHRHNLPHNQNLMNVNNPIGNVNRNITNFENTQQQIFSANNQNPNIK